MGGAFGVLIGLPLAVFGFLVMRNPMRLAFLSPWGKGYYQRMVLDTPMRNQLRLLGVLICLFGAGILTDSLGAVLKAPFFNAISEGLWVLMGCIFVAAWGFGVDCHPPAAFQKATDRLAPDVEGGNTAWPN